MKIYVETYNQVEGFHKWPEAPKTCQYLAHRHRHLFVISCSFAVTDENRELEINTMQNKVEDYLRLQYGTPMELGPMSCEMLAHELMGWGEQYHLEKVTVLEDNYGGATLSR